MIITTADSSHCRRTPLRRGITSTHRAESAVAARQLQLAHACWARACPLLACEGNPCTPAARAAVRGRIGSPCLLASAMRSTTACGATHTARTGVRPCRLPGPTQKEDEERTCLCLRSSAAHGTAATLAALPTARHPATPASSRCGSSGLPTLAGETSPLAARFALRRTHHVTPQPPRTGPPA